MTERERITRRKFLKAAAYGTAALALPGCARGLRATYQTGVSPFLIGEGRRVSPNEKLNIACIGAGGQGKHDVAAVSGENIVALCDVDEERAAKTYAQYPDVPKYRDFRRMFDKMNNQIDAVTITTPDHMHYPIALTAIELGKHVYLQKPLTHTIWEARRLTEAARERGVVTQMGNQRHSLEGIRLFKEWIDADAIGPVHEVQLWTDRPIWPQGIGRPSNHPPVPSTLDWNLWVGTAPKRPYHPAYVPFKWRGWWDFGCGALGDMACHIMDAAYWALELGWPEYVGAVSSPVSRETAPEWSIVTYHFPARGERPPLKLTWYDGGKLPPRPPELEPERNPPQEIGGQYVFGEKGTIMTDAYCKSPRIIPEAKMRAFERPPKTIPRSPGHHQEWIDACKGRGRTTTNFDYSGPLTELVLLGNLAIRMGARIEWDPVNLRCTNVPEANEYIRHGYRAF